MKPEARARSATALIGAAVFIAIIITASLVFWTNGRESDRSKPIGETRDGLAMASPSDEVVSALVPERGDFGGTAHSSSAAGGAVRQVLVFKEDLAERTASNLALSVEEALWLTQFGYPSAWELQNLDLLDWSAVRTAASRGDTVAQSLLAEQLLANGGDVRTAAMMFNSPNSLNSIYGMVRGAELLASLGRSPRVEDNYGLFMLYAEYARLMGDHQIDHVIDRVLPSTVNRLAFRHEVLRDLPGFVTSRFDIAARTGLPPPRPASRPNEEQWRQIRQGGTSQVVTVQLPSRFARQPGG